MFDDHGSNIILDIRDELEFFVRTLLELNVIEFYNSIPAQQSSSIKTH
jgi:hypothetical protein